MPEVNNLPSERGVLSGIIQYGLDIYLDIADIIVDECFTDKTNREIYHVLKHIYSNSEDVKIDTTVILAAAKTLGLKDFLDSKEDQLYFKTLCSATVRRDNVPAFAKKIRKLHIARSAQLKLREAYDNLNEINGDESIGDILSKAEEPISSFALTLLDSTETDPQYLGDEVEEYINFVGDNKNKMQGISTGFPILDESIGGGLLPGTINIIGARMKVGKSFFGLNVAYNVFSNNIPVLYLDTEMTTKVQFPRLLGIMSGVPMRDIKFGTYIDDMIYRPKVESAKEELKKKKDLFAYKSVSGKSYDEIFAIMKRWLIKKVGRSKDGPMNKCVIVFDYLKMLNSSDINKNMVEHEKYGYLMMKMHDFVNQYDTNILTFVQLNRAGMKSEDTDGVSGSDRIGFNCDSLTILKKKSPEEIAEDGHQNGNRKMKTVLVRHGGGLDDNDYVCVDFQKDCGRMIELNTRFQLKKNKKSNNEKFDIIDQSAESNVLLE